VLPTEFSRNKPGRLLKHARGYWVFIPNPLPPEIPLTWELAARVSDADRAISELAGVGRMLPNPYLLIRPFMSREAILSSRIEGTRASLSDLFFFEAASEPPSPGSDVREVHNYVTAFEYGLRRMRDLPVSLRLIREIHRKLMDGMRGEHLTPGEFRRSQNWIGPPGCTLNEATFVPPPHEEMKSCLSELEKFWHEPAAIPLVVRLALVHYQFEVIHPFLDGNGRMGRLLMGLMLCHENILPQPLLYLSAYFERHRDEYYRHLLLVSQQGKWTEWISFFLQGVTEQARDAVQRAGRLLEMREVYREQFQSARSSGSLLRLIDALFDRPYITVTGAAKIMKVTFRAANMNVAKLVDAGILHELPGRSYRRIFRAAKIVRLLEQEQVLKSGAKPRSKEGS
jgi:Fic family protein